MPEGDDSLFFAGMTERGRGWIIVIILSALAWAGLLWLGGTVVDALTGG